MLNEIIFIDKTGLEDLLQYQKIEFEILDGYYFNEGRNNKINIIANTLYTLRRDLKNNINPAEIVIKLILNIPISFSVQAVPIVQPNLTWYCLTLQ